MYMHRCTCIDVWSWKGTKWPSRNVLAWACECIIYVMWSVVTRSTAVVKYLYESAKPHTQINYLPSIYDFLQFGLFAGDSYTYVLCLVGMYVLLQMMRDRDQRHQFARMYTCMHVYIRDYVHIFMHAHYSFACIHTRSYTYVLCDMYKRFRTHVHT